MSNVHVMKKETACQIITNLTGAAMREERSFLIHEGMHPTLGRVIVFDSILEDSVVITERKAA